MPICTKESLNSIIQRDNAVLIGEYSKIIQSIKIHFRCHCGNESEKNCLQLIRVSGAFCNICTRITWTRKQKETNIKRYGVECTIHVPEIKEKIKQNNIIKYGFENVFKSPIIKEKIKQTCLENYGVEHPMKTQEMKERVRKICLEKFGVENPMHCEKFKEKIKQTCLERYGVEHISQSEDFKEKFKQTCLERYGVEHIMLLPEFRERIREIFIEKFGVDNPNKVKDVRDKIKQTCLIRYGEEHPSQSEKVQQKMQKNAKKYKEYKMPSGVIRKVQGYEPYALDNLIENFEENDIITDRCNIPRITYFDPIKNKNRYYFPDIYIKSINKIIEVKSTWTYKCKEDNIQLKEKATNEAGYNYEIWVYNKKGIKVET